MNTRLFSSLNRCVPCSFRGYIEGVEWEKVDGSEKKWFVGCGGEKKWEEV